MRWKDIALTLALFAAAACLLAPALDLRRVSNCGGNSAVLSDVWEYFKLAQVAAWQSPTGSFDVCTTTPEQRESLSLIAHDHWIGEGRFLVSSRPYRPTEAGASYVLMVCNRPF